MATLNKYNLLYLNWPHSAFELQSTKAAIILVWISPFLREKAALVQVERLYPTACSLKYTSSEVNHTVILCYRYVLYPCSLFTKLDSTLVLLYGNRDKRFIVDLQAVMFSGAIVAEGQVVIYLPYATSRFHAKKTRYHSL